MKLIVKDMDIATGGPVIALLNEKDAEKFDLHHMDRVYVTKGKKTIVAIVDIGESNKAVPPGQVGLFEEALDGLNAIHKDNITLAIANKPESLRYIKKKLDGAELKENEIFTIVKDIVKGRLIDTELTYYVAGNYVYGMTDNEIINLTKSMIETGDKLEHPKNMMVVDKHCIGGVAGNRTTMGAVPILLAGGLLIPKTSSRAITSPAGTADTMEVLCNVSFKMHELKKIIKKVGGCIVWGGAINLAPADDTIINVEHPLSIDAEGQLIASIMAKKGSVGATHVLIDIPLGPGSKIESKEKAIHLKSMFEKIGEKLGMKIRVMLTEGKEPVGNGIGPALEARDIMWMLSNHPNQPADLRKKCIEMAGILFEMTGKAKKGSGMKMATEILNSGAAYKKMWDIIKAQGAKIKSIDDIKIGQYAYNIVAEKTGKILHLNNQALSKIARVAGCPKDFAAGIYLHKHIGDEVKKGDKIFTIYSKNTERLKFAKQMHEIVDGVTIK